LAPPEAAVAAPEPEPEPLLVPAPLQPVESYEPPAPAEPDDRQLGLF
jgi:hypothetical protein